MVANAAALKAKRATPQCYPARCPPSVDFAASGWDGVRGTVTRCSSQAIGTEINNVTANKPTVEPVNSGQCSTDTNAKSMTITWTRKIS